MEPTDLADRLASRLRVLVVAWVALFVAIVVATVHYNDAQTAADAATFRVVVEAGPPWRFVVAAVLDLGFAVVYGLIGFAVGWRDRPGEPSAWRTARRGAGLAVVAGAAFDLAENALVIANVVGREALTDGRVDVMRALGLAKWAFGLAGAVGLAVSLLASRRR